MATRTAATEATPWVAPEKIDQYVQTEPAMVMICLALAAGLVYRFFLRNLTAERGESLRANFQNLAFHLGLGAFLFILYRALGHLESNQIPVDRVSTYVGIATIIQGAVVLVKIARIYIFEYMYLSHQKVAFPLLVVNLFSLLLSIGMGTWVAVTIFGVRVAPLLATSAIFSVVLGLAMQDTLGNLFSGISLQFDKPYEIGCWIEIQSGSQKWVGQVLEVHWRATVLTGLSDELITIPNRIMAQAQIANYTRKRHPILRNLIFKIPYGTDDALVRETLLGAAKKVQSVRLEPRPLVLAADSTDSGIAYKLVYAVEDYGSQWAIADQVIASVLSAFTDANIVVASPRLEVRHQQVHSA